jgi:hypothetical protein
MRLKHVVHFALIVLLAGGFASSLWAQKAELYGYGGFFWPNKTPVGQLGSDGIYGIKLGGYMTPHAQLEGNFGYINHFDLDRDPSPIAGALGIVRPAVRAITYDLNGSWNFSQRSLGGARVTPYVTVGAGALTALIPDAPFVAYTTASGTGESGSVFNATSGAFEPTGQRLVLSDKDTFFAVSYGGGLKALNLWGPLGLRGDIRGRTIPNFVGHNSVTWPELTGGVTFSWGER